MPAEGCNTDTTQTQPYQIPNTQRTENKTTDVVIQQHSRKLLMIDTLISETVDYIRSEIKQQVTSSWSLIFQRYINSSGGIDRILKEQFGQCEDCECRSKILELRWE